MRCQNCGSLVKDGANFCKDCGTKIEKCEVPAIETTTAKNLKKHIDDSTVPKTESVCPHCGAELKKKEQMFCVSCGKPLDHSEQNETKNPETKQSVQAAPKPVPDLVEVQKHPFIKYVVIGAVMVILVSGAYFLGGRSNSEPLKPMKSAENSSPNVTAPVENPSASEPVKLVYTGLVDDNDFDSTQISNTDYSYLLANSDTQKLTRTDLNGYTKAELTLMRNEIFARHGYPFQMKKFQDYFDKKDWYVRDDNYNYSLTDIELANVELIKALEKEFTNNQVSEPDNSFMIADSSTRKLTRTDLAGYSKSELTLIRNEIFARHGYPFQMKKFQDYFSKKDWYVRDDNYNYSLTDIELANVELIKELENEFN